MKRKSQKRPLSESSFSFSSNPALAAASPSTPTAGGESENAHRPLLGAEGRRNANGSAQKGSSSQTLFSLFQTEKEKAERVRE